MREILFRGKRKDNGEWVEGYYAKLPYYLPDGFTGGNKEMHIIIPVDDMLYPRCEISRYEEVDPDTVGQYIGANDKDGKKVFEGDVLERKSPWPIALLIRSPSLDIMGIERRVIGYEYSGFTHTEIYPHKRDYSDAIDDNAYGICISNYKVIGNIHDNPELLKGETNNEG